MRQIKFRGLRTDGKGWVYGYYYKLTESQHYILKDIHRWYVIPESVGQFTGLLDKNGVEIYEGDIVNLLADSISEKLGKAYGSWDTKCDFIKDSFKLTCIDKKHLVWRFTDLDFNGSPFIREVIGNMHENK